MNKIRSQLGPEFGQRTSYQAMEGGNGFAYTAFDTSSRDMLARGGLPRPQSMYIETVYNKK